MKISINYKIIFICLFIVLLSSVTVMAGDESSNNFRFNFNRLYFDTNPFWGDGDKDGLSGFLVVQVKDAIKMINSEEMASNKIFRPQHVDFISFSYSGSSGQLGFSSGYVTSRNDMLDGELESDDGSGYSEEMKNLYVGLDMIHSVALTDDINVGLRAGLIYIGDIYRERKDDALSVLFVMPVEISKRLTIEPRIHWTRTLTEQDFGSGNKGTNEDLSSKEDNVSLYGGVSVSLSY
ncbi:MAG: hypothetical protein OEV64_13100 [Desulfobulbaceae bacterium]|nr:hypothetical protein [Desulfobulbaceae bacterium]